MKDSLRYAAEWTSYAVEQRKAWASEAPDYALIVIEPDLAELPPVRPPWQRLLLPDEPSMHDLADALRAVGDDPRTRGVVLHLRALELPAATLESLRSHIAELRAQGKRVIAWATQYGTGSLYVASSCDEVLLQKGGGIAPLGVMRTYPFLAGALEQVGLRFDAVPISPYKSAADTLARRDMSSESRAMATWLIEGAYEEFVQALAEGRSLEEGALKAVIDGAPYTDLEAVEHGLVDAIVSEERLPTHLADRDEPAVVERWQRARKAVVPRPPARGARHIGLLRIEGMIVDGESRHAPRGAPGIPLLGGDARAGDRTVVQEARKALEDDDVAALVVWIDSPGGSATASEAMAAALDAVAERKPVLAVMGAVAGSGGYYVATPARHIFARPGTITGSIGVLSGKMVVSGLLDRMRINREVIARGEGIRIYDGDRPFSTEEEAIVRRGIQRTYDVFVARVAASRGMSIEDVEAVAAGRVWTGRQALAHGLIDTLGGLDDAYAMARELAGLGPRAARREIHLRRDRIGPLAGLATAAAVASGLAPATSLAASLETMLLLERANALCLCPQLVFGAPRLV